MSDEVKTNPQSAIRNPQSGYALVALLALMTIMMLAVVAVAPSIRQQQQREYELESIRRGDEVAEAIKLFRQNTNRFPNSIEELLKGVPSKVKLGKNVQILRAEAARDPLSKSGEWRVVRRGDPVFAAFQRSLIKYAGTLPTPDQSLGPPPPQPILGLENLNKTSDDKDAPPGGDDETPNTNIGEIIGVVSRSQRASVVNYYGIARHDRWVFTPFYR